jgi:hypothetical protein
MYEKFRSMSVEAKSGMPGKRASEALEGELERLMGVEPQTVPDQQAKQAPQDRDQLLEAMENEIRISGAEAVFKVKFKHIAP